MASSGNQWSLADELEFLTTMAELREANGGEIPAASLILYELLRGKRPFSRVMLPEDVFEKMCNLKNQFKKAVAKVVAGNSGGNNHLITRFDRHRELYHLCLKVWPELAP